MNNITFIQEDIEPKIRKRYLQDVSFCVLICQNALKLTMLRIKRNE
jgi:hypothetical protein